MKSLKRFTILAIALVSATAFAADPPAGLTPTSVKGKLDITYNTRTRTTSDGKPDFGVKDLYVFDLSVTDTLIFQGNVEHLPTILSSTLGREQQQALLAYNLNLGIRNPKNLAQTRVIGKLVGGVPIDKAGVYQFDQGTLRMAVDASGQAQGFESKFRGIASGKPPVDDSTLGRAKKKAVTLTKSVKGKTVKIVVTDYDIMTYSGFTLAAGPVKTYPETTVNGEMMYDYERSAWYFRNVTMSYQVEGKTITDKLSGNIKWVEHPQRKSNGEGEYQFDVRVNEPEQKSNEAAVFDAPADEEAFFTADSTLPSLTGNAKYKDTMRGDSVASSAVVIDLNGNNLSKQQIVNLSKLLWWVNVVPMNAE